MVLLPPGTLSSLTYWDRIWLSILESQDHSCRSSLTQIMVLHNSIFHTLTTHLQLSAVHHPNQHPQTKLQRWFCPSIFPTFSFCSIFDRNPNLPRIRYHSYPVPNYVHRRRFVPKPNAFLFITQLPPAEYHIVTYPVVILTRDWNTDSLSSIVTCVVYRSNSSADLYFYFLLFKHWTAVYYKPNSHVNTWFHGSQACLESIVSWHLGRD